MKTETVDTFEEFVCLSCNQNTFHMNEYYMIHDNLWEQVNPQKEGMLCIGCVENILGRELTANDFPNYPINHLDLFHKSERLVNRLTTIT